MPHIVLEYSDNIIEKDTFGELFERLHGLLVEGLQAKLPACKSRAVPRASYLIGDGQTGNAFVHVSLKVMSGRTQEALDAIGREILGVLETHFTTSITELGLQISLEVSELSPGYFKLG